MHTMRSAVALAALAILIAGCVPAGRRPSKDQGMEKSEQSSSAAMMEEESSIFLTAGDLRWVKAPAALPAGAEVAVLEGDPAKPGPFTIRLKLPAEYTVPPHEHPADEHVTVISGTFAVGLGETFDTSKLNDLKIGGFAMMQKGVRHFAWSRDGGVIQLHGIGPWGLLYVHEEEDPRNQEAAE